MANQGLISEVGLGSYGISLAGGGTVTNTASDTIIGNVGIAFAKSANDTLIDSDTIIGTGGTAVSFGSGINLMRLQPGKLLIQGAVNGATGTSTLEFASSASIGALTGVGADFYGFSQGTVDTGASWVLTGEPINDPAMNQIRS